MSFDTSAFDHPQLNQVHVENQRVVTNSHIKDANYDNTFHSVSNYAYYCYRKYYSFFL